MALTKTTKLQAINTMLSVVGEPPVNSLSAQRADSLIAQTILDEVTREVLTYGWQFNTEDDVTMTPESNTGFIYISDSTVRVDMDRSYSSYDIVIRGNRLFNRKNNSYVFVEPIKVIRVDLMDYDDLPEIAKHLPRPDGRLHHAARLHRPRRTRGPCPHVRVRERGR
jgi:hypothetical protein